VAFLPNGIISLLSDLGHNDPSVGIIKGNIYSRYREAKIVDLCHLVPVQDVTWASYALWSSYKHFPGGTVHCAIVDPRAGKKRKILCVETAGHIFVAPDNGVLTNLTNEGARAYALDLERVPVAPVRRGWHTRDIIAPVAALLASGKLNVEEVGPIEENPYTLDLGETIRSETSAQGGIVGEDRFGNLFTSMTELDLPDEGNPHDYVAEFGDQSVRVVNSYRDVEPGKLLALFNSFGLLEIAVRNGQAARTIEWSRGTQVTVRLHDE
jgi:S-adenosyl-L-methionine hydrolase (adenosine-forming)